MLVEVWPHGVHHRPHTTVVLTNDPGVLPVACVLLETVPTATIIGRKDPPTAASGLAFADSRSMTQQC